MRRFPLLVFCICTAIPGFCQTDSLASLLKEGTELHDKGDYTGAIAKYDAILAVDGRYFNAYIEKTLSLYQGGRFQECVDLCRKVIKGFPGEAGLKNVYVSYGSALDGLVKPDEAIKTYKEGIRMFPGYYLLPFNKGMTEYSQKQMEDAVKDYEAAITINHGHASSHQYLGYAIYPKNKMAAAMALTCFLLVEPRGKRAEKNLPILLKLLGANVERKDEKTINITMAMPKDDLKKQEDDFHLTEMMMSFSTAAAMGKESKDTTAVDRLRRAMEILAIAKADKKGFFSNTYVDLLAGLEKADLLETAAHIAYLSAGDATNQQWLGDHAEKVQEFYRYMDDWIKR
jgi:hypothetical protein